MAARTVQFHTVVVVVGTGTEEQSGTAYSAMVSSVANMVRWCVSEGTVCLMNPVGLKHLRETMMVCEMVLPKDRSDVQMWLSMIVSWLAMHTGVHFPLPSWS